jgi:hypothetical protein
MPYKFITPSIEEGPLGPGRLFGRYRINRGVSVYKYAGEYYEMRYPTEDDINTYATFYVGGHEYIVDDAEAADLIAAGYEVVEVS